MNKWGEKASFQPVSVILIQLLICICATSDHIHAPVVFQCGGGVFSLDQVYAFVW